jgi:hypothetical protein
MRAAQRGHVKCESALLHQFYIQEKDFFQYDTLLDSVWQPSSNVADYHIAAGIG